MNGHTPGPWVTDEKDHDGPYQDIQIKGKWNICKLWIDDAPVRDYNSEQWANARLISAAPDLLSALERLVRQHGSDGIEYSGDHPIAVARAAIAKATGVTA